MSTKTFAQVGKTSVNFAELRKWFSDNEKRDVKTAELRPVAILATIWTFDLLSNLANIASAVWFDGRFEVPPVITGLLCAAFANLAVLPFIQVLTLSLFHFAGLYSIWKKLGKTEWPQWIIRTRKGMPVPHNPAQSSLTHGGILIGFLISAFLMFLFGTLSVSTVFIQGVRQGVLNSTVATEHFVLAATLIWLAALPFITGRLRHDHTIPIRIFSEDPKAAKAMVYLNETSWSSDPVIAMFDSDLRPEILSLFRQNGSADPYQVEKSEDLQLTQCEWVFINIAAIRHTFEKMARYKYDRGDEDFYTAEISLTFLYKKPQEGKKFDAVSIECAKTLLQSSDNLCLSFQAAIDGAIQKFADLGQTKTLSEFRQDFEFMRLEIEKEALVNRPTAERGLSEESSRARNRRMAPLNEISDDDLQAQLNRIESLTAKSKTWEQSWNPVKGKLRTAAAEIPKLFQARIESLFGVDPDVQATAGNIGSFLIVDIEVRTFALRDGKPKEIDELLPTLTGRLADRSRELQEERDKRKKDAEDKVRSDFTELAFRDHRVAKHYGEVMGGGRAVPDSTTGNVAPPALEEEKPKGKILDIGE